MIARILQNRLLSAASLQDHKLILECYHPTAKLSTPGFLCDYLGTDIVQPIDRNIGQLGHLKSLYSHFRPTIPEDEPRRRRRHPAAESQVTDTAMETTASTAEIEVKKTKGDLPSQLITLESHELFSQLVTVANLVKVGPKRGLFLSCVTIGEGVMRVWRDWLGTLAVPKTTPAQLVFDTDEEYNEARTLWLDRDQNIGVRLRVYEREDLNAAPVLRSDDEDVTAVWEVEYEELFIRTTALLLKVEESLQQESNHSGKAIVIGSW